MRCGGWDVAAFSSLMKRSSGSLETCTSISVTPHEMKKTNGYFVDFP